MVLIGTKNEIRFLFSNEIVSIAVHRNLSRTSATTTTATATSLCYQCFHSSQSSKSSLVGKLLRKNVLLRKPKMMGVSRACNEYSSLTQTVMRTRNGASNGLRGILPKASDDSNEEEEETRTPKPGGEKKRVKEKQHFKEVIYPGLQKFYERFKHLNVPKSYIDRETKFAIGRAVHNYRSRNTADAIDEDEREKLREIGSETNEEFVWDADQFVFEKQLLPSLELYKAKYGHLNVPHRYVLKLEEFADAPDGDDNTLNVSVTTTTTKNVKKPYLDEFNLGLKVNDIRAKGTYILHNPTRLEKLANLGFVWDDHEFKFNNLLVPALTAYRLNAINEHLRKQYDEIKATTTSIGGDNKRQKSISLKNFAFTLPWSATINAQDFEDLISKRPYLRDYPLGGVCRRALLDSPYSDSEHAGLDVSCVKVLRAKRICRVMQNLGVVVDPIDQ